jgi:uncharacterized integral membrane protein
MADDDVPTTTEAQARRGGLAHDARLIAATVVLVAFVVFALDNRRATHVSWIVGGGDAPLWLLLVVAAGAGAIIGLLASHRPQRRHG